MESQAPDVPVFPRTYRMSIGLRIFSFIVGPALIGFGAVGFVKLEPEPSIVADILWHALAMSFSLLGAYCIISAAISRVVLDRDSYTVISPFGRRTIFRNQIRGRREISRLMGPGWLVLEMRDAKRKRIWIERDFRRDAVLNEWIASLPGLTKAEPTGGAKPR